jgi:hypothetical protein
MAKGKSESTKSSNDKFRKGLRTNTANIRRPTRGGTRL